MNKKDNQTYVIIIINNDKIVTLNREYLKICSSKKIDGSWSVEYIEALLSSSFKIDKEKIRKLKKELSKHSTSTRNEEQKGNNFEYFFIYDGATNSKKSRKLGEKLVKF